ncbi:MAG: CPBP family intramembrane glutamic endopeptidase [Candidatus Hodarchaeota archaeon]
MKNSKGPLNENINENYLITRLKSLFSNKEIFMTVLVLWFILVYLALPFFGSIIQDQNLLLILMIVFPFVYLVIPLYVIKITSNQFLEKETSLDTLWKGESPEQERKYIIYHVGFVWAIYFFIAQFGGPLMLIMLLTGIIVFIVGLIKGWLLTTDGGVERFRDYFKRLDKGQILFLLFMFVGLAGGMSYFGYVIIFAYIAAIIVHDRIKPSQLGARSNKIILLVPVLLVMVLPSFAINYLIWMSGNMELLGGDNYTISQALYMYLVVGFGEEISFKVVFQTYLERRYGSQRGIVIASTLFAICHIPSHLLGMAMLFGSDLNLVLVLSSISILLVFYYSMISGYVWYRTRNIWVISGAHMLVDSSSTIIYRIFN